MRHELRELRTDHRTIPLDLAGDQLGAGGRELTTREINRRIREEAQDVKRREKAASNAAGAAMGVLARVQKRHPDNPKAQLAMFFGEFVIKSGTGRKRPVSKRTCSAYSDGMIRMIDDLRADRAAVRNLGEIGKAHVLRLIRYWLAQGQGSGTIQNKISILRRFLTFIGKENIVPKGHDLRAWLNREGVEVPNWRHTVATESLAWDQNDVDLPVFPVFALNNLASGITTVIPAIDISKPSLGDAKILLSQILQLKVNCMTLAPSSFRNLAIYCNENGTKLKGISRVLTGGAPISETDISKFITTAPHSKNWILYGSTEVEPIAYIESKKMLSIKAPKLTNVTKVGVNVGKIDKALRYKCIDIETGDIRQAIDIQKREVDRGEIGELIVAGKHVCLGYYKNKEAFLRTKIKDKSGTVWHRTGDLARIDQSGYLWIVGRRHNVIKLDNDYFFPVRPEIILKDIPHITNAAYLNFNIKP